MIRPYSQMHRTDEYSEDSSIIWPDWLNGWVFVYEPSGCGFESRCSHLNFRFGACLEQGVSWHSGNYRVWIKSESRSSKEFLDINTTIECIFTLKRVRDMIRTYSLMHRTDKYSQNRSIIWLNGWMFVYELSGCRFESRYNHLNIKFPACFKQRVPWHSGNYRVWIRSEMRTWHYQNIQSNAPYR